MPETVPPLEAALAALSASLPDQVLSRLRETPEEEVWQHQFRLGASVREVLGLWRDSPLAQWLTQSGISHPDDMSHQILLELRQQLLRSCR